jgi:trimeric autotransporter adhesin
MNATQFKNNRFKLVLTTINIFFLLWTMTAMLFAQSYQGGVRGTVTDPQGAAVGNVKVTLTNQGTNESRSTVTNADGTYVFSAVDPANYAITAEAPSFKKFERTGVTVGTQQFLTVDLGLQVGDVTQSVMVTEQVPLIDASNASQGQEIDRQKLIDLPNLGRNPFMMARVAQNVVAVGNPAYNRMEDQSGSSQISIAGGPIRGNNYLLDGIPITDANNRAIIIPTLEAVQEVNVQANTYDAEMARTGGGMFNTLLKSGTNQYHGVLFGSTRQTGWSANNFFNNAAGIPLPDQYNYTFGASFGGKVWIPKVYDGKDKTFFWLAWEGYDDTQANSQQFAAPTALERQGNFSQSLAKGGGLNVIYNPLSTVQNADGSYSRTPFPNNIIPASQINPVGANIANTYVLPQTTSAFYGSPNVTAAANLPARAAQFTGKIDHQVTDWWHVNVSYLRYFSLEPGNTWFPTISSPDQWRLQRRVDATQANSVFTLSPTSVLTVRYGFNRFPNYGYQVSQGFNLGSLGFDPSYVAQVASPTFPNVGMTSQYSLGTNNNFYYVHSSKNASASISKFAGRHSLKGGFDYRRLNATGNDFSDSAGNFQFNGIYSRSTPASSGTGGADLADLLMGDPFTATGYLSTKLNDFVDYYGAYIQDDFRLSSKITLNFGLRYERENGIQEQNNRLAVGFNTEALNPLAANVSGLLPKGVLAFAGQNGNRESVGNYNLNKFGPRVGMAWQLNSKTTIRGGYGLFWAPQFAIGAPLNTPGFTATTNAVTTVDNYAHSAVSLTNPFPGGLAQPVGESQGDLTGVGQGLTIVDPNAKSPRVQQFSIDVQRELPFGIAFEVGYVASRTSHLTLGTGNININALNPTQFAQGSALTQTVNNPFYGKGGAGVIGSSTISEYQLLLPYPTFGQINYQFSDRNHARYDSMVVKAQKRMSQGLTFLSTFTLSRMYDGSSGGAGNFLNSGNQSGPQNPYDMNSEYGLSYADSPYRWTNTFTYELPFGKGKPFANSRKLWDYIVGGWSLNAISIFQTGFPLQIYQNTNFNSQFGYATQRPNATGVSPVTSGSLEQRLNNYINPAAFSQAPEFTFGNVARTIGMRGPGMANWDASLFKSFTIGERFHAQFRTALMNAFNTPLFAAPNTAYTPTGNNSFGQITSQANFSRMVELGIRLFF